MASLDKHDIASAFMGQRDGQSITYVCTFAISYKDFSVKDMSLYRKSTFGFVQKFEDIVAELIGRENQAAEIIIRQHANAMKRYPRMYNHGIPVELPDDVLDQIKRSFLDLGLTGTSQRG